MHIKRFEAPTIEAALARVKQELGPDALILSSRTIQRGRHAFGLLSRSVIEVQAAVERTSEPLPEPAPEPALARPDPARPGFEADVRAELRAMRQTIARLSAAHGRVEADDVVGRLEGAGLDSALATALATETTRRTADGEAMDWTRLLEDRLEARCVPPRAVEGGGIRMLVGAPGVGKTTSLAKLAARNEEGEREVALVALDHYRIGAPDQLRRYAELLESPFVEAGEVTEIPSLASRYRGHEILVDTAGRGRRAEERMAALEPLRDRLGPRARIELVIDATARPEVQRAQLDRFADLSPDRVILTKTDECERLAPLANLILDPSCPPICWQGTGQRVPEDLAPIEPRAIVRDVAEAAA